MSDSKPDWDALIPFLYKEFWAENVAIYILLALSLTSLKQVLPVCEQVNVFRR